MGKCISKNNNPKKDIVIVRKEESLCTPIQSEGARNMVYSGPQPILLKNMDNIDTQVESSLHKSTGQTLDLSIQRNSSCYKMHSRNTSKISIDFDQLSKLKIEQEMLLRIGRSLHELARCYQKLENYGNSVELLQLSGEIYMHLGNYVDFNTAMADLLIAYIGNEHLHRKIPIVIEPLDERTQIVCSTFKYLTGHKRDTYLIRYNISDFHSLLEVSKEIDACRLGSSNIVDALLDLGHLFRIWLQSPAESLNLYEEAEIYDPHNPEINFYKGLSYRAMGNIELAVESYAQGISKNSKFADCYFNLGNIYLEEKQDLQEAEACYLNALFGCENGHQGLVSVGKICNMLSDVYFFNGNPGKALEVLVRGIGADFLCLDNYAKASKIARLMDLDNISSLLAMVGMIFNDQPIGDLPEHIEEEALACKNVLFGAIGELLAFVHEMPKIEKLSKSERISVKQFLGKITPEQISKLKEFYCALERI